jgi:UDP-GlcNAc:undecaprenyl-phosphate GlcNAc-1-phosphate transferase
MFNKIEILFAVLILSVIILIFHRYSLKILNKYKIYDINGLIKKKRIPTSYGIFLLPHIILCSFIIAIFYPHNLPLSYIAIPFSISALTIICLIDDHKSVPITVRLVTFYTVTYLSLGTFNFVNLIEYFYFEKLLILFIATAWVYFINCANFLDGGDEYFANSLIPSFGFLSYFYYFSLYNDIYFFFNFIILIFLIVFRTENKNPAKVYLGDSGSVTIGFIYFFNILKLIEMSNYEIAFLLSIFILLDPTITILVRLKKKLSIFKRHQGFFFHVAKKLGIKEKKISYYMFLNNLIISFSAIMILQFDHYKYIFLIIGLSSQIFFLLSMTRFKINFFLKNQ